MKVTAIIQARFSSTRLPGKVLYTLPFDSKTTVLSQVIRRLKKAATVNEIIVATTHEKDADAIERNAAEERIKVFRGSESNVLARYYGAAKENKADAVVRITSDCPCVDPEIVDKVVMKYRKKHCDYASNILTRTYPRGLDVEVFSFSALEKAFKKSTSMRDKEHVTAFMYNNQSQFSCVNSQAPAGLHRPDLRITLDTRQDYALLCALYDYLYQDKKFFTAGDIIRLFNKKPWLSLINEEIVQKGAFLGLREELKEAKRLLGFYGLMKARSLLR